MIVWERLAASGWKAPKFSDAQKKKAVAAVTAMEAVDGNPEHVAQLWPESKDLPDISQIDFGDAYQAVWNLADLRSANGHDWLNRRKLLDHIAAPGDSLKNPNPFTQYPIITKTSSGLAIVDGHHRLGALMLLGAKTWQLWTVPASQ